MTSTEERLAALEAAVARLTERFESEPAAAEGPSGYGGDFWLLDELSRRRPQGGLIYAGQLDLPTGPVRWQMGVDPAELLESDWHETASALVALAHAVRLRLVQLVLTGVETTAELAQDEELGTTGQLHHHLRQLVAAGWLVSAGRGRYTVPPHRVVPVLLVVAAAGR